MISALPHTKYLYEPGTHFSYSNIGYAILGAALSRAAHQPYTDYVKERILLPLGMTHSDFEATPAIRQNLTIGYNKNKEEKLDAETAEKEHQSGRGYKVPNGALYTTVGDMAKFEQLEMLGEPENVLSKKELEENAHRLIAARRSHCRLRHRLSYRAERGSRLHRTFRGGFRLSGHGHVRAHCGNRHCHPAQ